MSEETTVRTIPEIPAECRFSSYEMTQYILKALALEDPTKTTNKHIFSEYGYGGSLKDLFNIVDDLASGEGKITKYLSVPGTAWGAGWNRKIPGLDTNLNYAEIDLFMERVHYLLNQQVIGPGFSRDVSESLPWLHVTEYGKQCLENIDILPYDSDGYLRRIQACAHHDDWDEFYMDQTLKCFNNGLYNSATMMLGLEGEYLTEKLIDKYSSFLSTNDQTEKSIFESAIGSCGNSISQKYQKYIDSLKNLKKKKDQTTQAPLYPYLQSIHPHMDTAADQAFMNYLRMTRNENDHPFGTIMEPAQTMLLIVSFLKYFEIQDHYIDIFVMNS